MSDSVPKNVLDPDLYRKARTHIYKIYPNHSAYRSGMLVKYYRDVLKGRYSGKKPSDGLTRWFKEDWKDIGGEDYPVYRPTRRISDDTPLTATEIDPKQLKSQIKIKQHIKGMSNLPPFKKKGGKLRATDVRNLLDASYQTEPAQNIGDWVLDNGLSNEYAKVYYKPDGSAVVAHRGTSGAMDWGNNLAYALGNYENTDRYRQGKAIQDQAESKYGAKNISTLGHSQGSILSRKLGANTKEIINVNPAYKGEVPLANEYNVRSSKDVVSSLYAPVSSVSRLLYPSYTNKHSITVPTDKSFDVLGNHSYDILNKLGDQEIGAGRQYPLLRHSFGRKVGGSGAPSSYEEYLQRVNSFPSFGEIQEEKEEPEDKPEDDQLGYLRDENLYEQLANEYAQSGTRHIGHPEITDYDTDIIELAELETTDYEERINHFKKRINQFNREKKAVPDATYEAYSYWCGAPQRRIELLTKLNNRDDYFDEEGNYIYSDEEDEEEDGDDEDSMSSGEREHNQKLFEMMNRKQR